MLVWFCPVQKGQKVVGLFLFVCFNNRENVSVSLSFCSKLSEQAFVKLSKKIHLLERYGGHKPGKFHQV